jgi:hypothetical protein
MTFVARPQVIESPCNKICTVDPVSGGPTAGFAPVENDPTATLMNNSDGRFQLESAAVDKNEYSPLRQTRLG